MNAMSEIGPTFCHVVRIRLENHDIEFMILGNHMWHGTIPSLIVRAIVIKM